MLGGVLGSAQLGVSHQKSFVEAKNVIYRIQKCYNVPVAARERRKQENKHKERERGRDRQTDRDGDGEVLLGALSPVNHRGLHRGCRRRDRDRQTETEKERQIERHKERERDRQSLKTQA